VEGQLVVLHSIFSTDANTGNRRYPFLSSSEQAAGPFLPMIIRSYERNPFSTCLVRPWYCLKNKLSSRSTVWKLDAFIRNETRGY
jgi:hypothetical protein